MNNGSEEIKKYYNYVIKKGASEGYHKATVLIQGMATKYEEALVAFEIGENEEYKIKLLDIELPSMSNCLYQFFNGVLLVEYPNETLGYKYTLNISFLSIVD